MSRLRAIIVFLLLSVVFVVVDAQTVRAVVVNEFANVRLTPAIGAEVLGSVNAGYEFSEITARTGDFQWIRVNFNGQEGWVNVTPLRFLEGDINSLPVADPRSIPYGGSATPRSGRTSQTGAVSAKATDGVRVRSGPSRAYPTLANINFNQLMTLTGRTASNLWYQVSFEGTLGWISSNYVSIVSGDVFALPIDGIVAEVGPTSGDSATDYFDTLRMMLDRINNAQPSLDTMRAYWTDSALTGRAACKTYPAQPSDVQIPQPVLAAYYASLEPLRVDMNDAMYNVRLSIELFIQVCNQPGTGNPVGRATVEGALGVVNLAQSQLDSLRARISSLLPDPLGDGECLLVYNGRSEALPIIKLDTIYLDEFSSRNYASGYCFDGIQGQSINAQTLPFPDSNVALFLSVSTLDAPATFLAVNRTSPNTRLAIGPITLTRTTRYVVIVADTGDPSRAGGPKGKFAVLLSSTTPTNYLVFNTSTGAIVTTTDAAAASVSSTAGTSTSITATPGASVTSTPTTSTVCPSTAFSCNQLFTCAEAKACLAAGNFSLDPDSNGIPCEPSLCTGP